ncbi:hypothetical protein ABZ467_11510 [Streptomyces sp. NPDC005727]|uniref:hypothetical protein n=1 Tax=Streptomyces sp. NPDC005727 TaxID=3157053 RepID=UPI0033E94B7A
MRRSGHTLRLTAVSALVVLALTGFTGRHGHSHSHSGGGGGCSSSSQDHDSSSSVGKAGSGGYHDYDDDDYGTSGSTSGGGTYSTPSPTPSLRAAKAKLLSCATEKAQYATVEVTNPNAVEGDFTVRVEFDDKRGTAVTDNTTTVTVPAKGTARAEVKLVDSLGHPDDGLILEIDHCRANPVAEPVG